MRCMLVYCFYETFDYLPPAFEPNVCDDCEFNEKNFDFDSYVEWLKDNPSGYPEPL